MQASCRRNFILEVVLIDAFGEPVKDKEVLCLLNNFNLLGQLLYLVV
jgi:hypothetical protein